MEDEAAKLDSNNTSFSCHCTDARQRSSVICCIDKCRAVRCWVNGIWIIRQLIEQTETGWITGSFENL